MLIFDQVVLFIAEYANETICEKENSLLNKFYMVLRYCELGDFIFLKRIVKKLSFINELINRGYSNPKNYIEEKKAFYTLLSLTSNKLCYINMLHYIILNMK